MVLQGILQESRLHYQTQYDYLVARLIHVPRGSLRRQQKKHKAYWYLRRHQAGKGYQDVYIGSVNDKACQALAGFVNERGQRMVELKAVKKALAQLGVKNLEFQKKNYPAIFIDLLEAFGNAGLWREGLSLIGSWCFNVYAQAFGVDFYPLRTMDFDFGLRIPYQGDKADIDALLKNLGFTAQIDMAYDKIDYVLPGIGMVEVFIDKAKATPDQVRSLKQNLSLRPAAVAYLAILLDHQVTVKIHGVHKAICLPSMPAFFVHRLITAKFGEYRDPVDNVYKVRKDYKQAALVAKKILTEPNLRQELAGIISGLSEDHRQKMMQSARAAAEYVRAPDLSQEDIQYIRDAAAL